MPSGPRPRVSPDPPRRITTAMSVQEWRAVSFLHWRVDPADIAERLPRWLEVDTFDGAAWVGLVPFRMRVRPPVGPVIPWAGEFPETNVRTYVVGPDGMRGLWFLSMDAARLAFVAPARAFGLPYVWSSMVVDATSARVRYEMRSRLALGTPARSRVGVVPGADVSPAEERPLDRFLTARFRLYGHGPLGRFAVQVEHPRWRLRRATVEHLEDGIVPAAGISAEGDPSALFSDGVTVRLGFPELLRTGTAQRSP